MLVNEAWDKLLKEAVPYSNDQLLLLYNLLGNNPIEGVEYRPGDIIVGSFRLVKNNHGNISVEPSYISIDVRTGTYHFIDDSSDAFFYGFCSEFKKIPLLMGNKNHVVQTMVKWRLLIGR